MKNPNNTLLTKEFLEKHYVANGHTIREIAKLFNLCESIVHERLIKFGIPRRNFQTEKHKQKLVESRKNNGKSWCSEETRKKLSEKNKGQIRSEETKQKMSLGLLHGRPREICSICKIRKVRINKLNGMEQYCSECERTYQRNYCRNRYKTDVNFKIGRILSTTLREGLKSQGVIKSKRAKELLGCTIEEFKTYIKNQFKPGMTWENNKMNGWHLDHKRCKASFNLKDIEEQKKCYHYTNYQPLWYDLNQKKSSWYKGKLYRKNI
jgi:hypothetical protein